MNRNVILAIIAIILIAIVGYFIFAQPATTDGKLNTQIKFLGETTLKNGDQVVFELKDAKGNALSEQNISIAYDDGSGKIQNYKIISDKDGKGYLGIDGEAAGKYDITVTFNATDKYNGCSAKETITIEEGTSDSTSSTESNSTANTVMYNNVSSSSSDAKSAVTQTFYDADLNVYYDINGRVIGGQSPGASIYDLRQNKIEFERSGATSL